MLQAKDFTHKQVLTVLYIDNTELTRDF